MTPPILHDFPESFETERLLIRCPQPGDGAVMNAAVAESLESLLPWLPWAEKVPTLEESEELARRMRCHFLERSDLVFSLFRKEDGAYVGGSGLHRIAWDIPRFEIGYWCRKSREGQGYITEAARGLTRFSFETLGAKRVEIRCAEGNVRSRRVAERAAFTLEAVMRNNCMIAGNVQNLLLFSLVPEEFAERYNNRIEKQEMEEA